jgi:GNAT superfamily N-acetyltransferase
MPNRPTLATRPRQHRIVRHTHRRPAARSVISDQTRVTILERAHSAALLAMVGRCSAMSLYRRFHGVTDGVAYTEQVLAGAARGDSYVAWRGDRCVGLGNLHVCDDRAEIGVLVEDGWQRRGVGSALVGALVSRARERRAPFLQADVLAENHFVLQRLASIGPMRTALAYGSYTVLVDLGLKTALVQTPSLIGRPGEIPPIQSVDEALGIATSPSGPGSVR